MTKPTEASKSQKNDSKFSTKTKAMTFQNLNMPPPSFIIYTVSSFPIINKQNLSIQQQLSISQVYYKCAVLHNVSMEFKRNFLFVYFVYIVTKVCVALLVQTSNSHRTGS